jgi:hypothetical protein
VIADPIYSSPIAFLESGIAGCNSPGFEKAWVTFHCPVCEVRDFLNFPILSPISRAIIFWFFTSTRSEFATHNNMH